MGYGTALIVSILIFSGVAIGVTDFYTDLNSRYNVPGPEYNLSTGNKTAVLNQKITDVQNKLTAAQGGGITALTSGGDILLTSSISAVQILLSVPIILASMASQAGIILGLPGWAITMIVAIVGAIVVMKVLGAILRSDI